MAIGVLVPWIVHLAPPRHRPVALLACIGLVVLYSVLRENAFLGWELWAGLAAGIVSVAFLAPGHGERGEPVERPARGASPWDDEPDLGA